MKVMLSAQRPLWIERALQFIRFSLVGGLNTCIDVLAFNCLVYLFPTGDTNLLLLFNTLAYLLGATNSFYGNKMWTFSEKTPITRQQVVHFMLVTALGILCNDLFLWQATRLLTSLSLDGFVWTNVAKVSAIAGSFSVSYIGMQLGVFTHKDTSKAGKATAFRPRNPNRPITTASLSVVLPAYNEEAVIEQTITTIVSTLSMWLPDFEVIVVNDGSKDRTSQIVARLATHQPRIRIINHTTNQGYGAALVTGFESFQKDLVFFMDADGQFDIHDLLTFFPLIEEYDAVLGYRIDRQDTWMRKLNAWGWKQLVRSVFNIRVRDVDCAFKLYRAEFFQTHRLETRGAMINTEILYKLARSGYSYTEVGVRHLPRRSGRSTGAKPTVILQALQELFACAKKWFWEETGIE